MSFFDVIRPMFGGRLTQEQVDGLSEVVNAFEQHGDGDVRKLAYIMATGFHEAKFRLVRESMKYTPERIRQVWPTRFKTLAAAQPYANNPQALANKVYGGRLGNNKDNDGWLFRGGGWPQLTGKENYAKFGLVDTPDRILEPRVSARVLVEGLLAGKFTGRKLSEFITSTKVDYPAARAAINGDKGRKEGKSTVGEVVAGYAAKFEKALHSTLLPVDAPVDAPVPVPVPAPKPVVVPEPVPALERKPLSVPTWLLWVAALFLAAAASIAIFL